MLMSAKNFRINYVGKM